MFQIKQDLFVHMNRVVVPSSYPPRQRNIKVHFSDKILPENYSVYDCVLDYLDTTLHSNGCFLVTTPYEVFKDCISKARDELDTETVRRPRLERYFVYLDDYHSTVDDVVYKVVHNLSKHRVLGNMSMDIARAVCEVANSVIFSCSQLRLDTHTVYRLSKKHRVRWQL